MEKHNLKIIYKLTTKLKDMLHSVKDSKDPLSTARVYRIPCACGEVDIGITQHSVKTRLKEYERHCHLIQPAVALHNLETGHKIRFEETPSPLENISLLPWIYRGAIETLKHQNNFNKKK